MSDEKERVIPIEEVSDDHEGLEKCTYHICVVNNEENCDHIRSGPWGDQMGFDNCALCDTPIVYRKDTAPAGAKKICYLCMPEAIEGDDNPQFITRKSAADEMREFYKKKEQH